MLIVIPIVAHWSIQKLLWRFGTIALPSNFFQKTLQPIIDFSFLYEILQLFSNPLKISYISENWLNWNTAINIFISGCEFIHAFFQKGFVEL